MKNLNKTKNVINSIICADVLDGLSSIEDGDVSLTFSSPPYNVAISYNSYEDNLSYDDYLKWLERVFSEVFRVTKNGGRLIVNIDAMTNRQDDKDEEYVRPIYPHLYTIMKSIGWKFRAEICWYKQNSVGRKTAWGSWMSASNPVIRRNHEYILCWSKGSWRLESEEKSDLTAEEFQQWTFSTWFVQPETRNIGGHPACFPEELARRVIKLFSFPNDIVLDPFNGVGTTTRMANILNRRYIGIDIDQDYCKRAEYRTIQEGRDIYEE